MSPQFVNYRSVAVDQTAEPLPPTRPAAQSGPAWAVPFFKPISNEKKKQGRRRVGTAASLQNSRLDGSIPSRPATLPVQKWGPMFQSGDTALQAACGGCDPRGLHQFQTDQRTRRPSSLDPGLISQVTRSITGACVQISIPRTRRDRRVESSVLETLRSRCESCRRDQSVSIACVETASCLPVKQEFEARNLAGEPISI